MRNIKYHLCFSIFVLGMNVGFSQAYKAGDKVEALVNHSWKEVKIIKVVAGKANSYEVQVDAAKTSLQLSKNNLRPILKNAMITGTASLVPTVMNIRNIHLGKYELYSGIPTMYIGHIILLGDGRYKVAFGTDEDNYETGYYSFNAPANTIEWKTGLFKNKGWGGKLVSKSGNAFRIEFNSTTYADTN